jgi:hypothetical protein
MATKKPTKDKNPKRPMALAKTKKPTGATESGGSKKAVKAPAAKNKSYGRVNRSGATQAGSKNTESFGSMHRKTKGLGVIGSVTGVKNRTVKPKPKSASTDFFLK